jgi:hypothetical protein
VIDTYFFHNDTLPKDSTNTFLFPKLPPGPRWLGGLQMRSNNFIHVSSIAGLSAHCPRRLWCCSYLLLRKIECKKSLPVRLSGLKFVFTVAWLPSNTVLHQHRGRMDNHVLSAFRPTGGHRINRKFQLFVSFAGCRLKRPEDVRTQFFRCSPFDKNMRFADYEWVLSDSVAIRRLSNFAQTAAQTAAVNGRKVL